MSLTADPERRDADRRPEAVTAPERPLAPGTLLRDYELREVAASSSWSIVYVAWDRALRRRVAVQEYRPVELAGRVDEARIVPLEGCEDLYALGLKAFVAEARLLARFDNPALVRIYRFWEEHGTAYRAMPLCEGPTLEQTLTERRQDEAEVRAWLRPLLDAVGALHAAHAWHHHVVPASIVLTSNGPVLLDMAAARRVVHSLSHGPAAAADPGYAGIELYSDAATLAPGPWTDLYALAAVAYRALTGVVPPAASERAIDDRLAPLEALAEGRCSARFAAAVEAALVVAPESRTRHEADFRALAGDMEPGLRTLPPSVLLDLMSEPFVLDPNREVTIPIPTQPQPSHGAAFDEAQAAASAVVATNTLPPDSRFGRATTPAPFERSAPNVSTGAWAALAGGVVLLGAVAAFALQGYAGRGARVAEVHPAAPSASTGSIASTAPTTPVPPTTPATSPGIVVPVGPIAPRVAEAVAPIPHAAPLSPDSPRAVDVVSAPRDDQDRHDRCADLLQEATLRRLSGPESAFFKKECR